MKGRVFQLNVSPGGVPKTAIPAVEVGPLGLEGDAHRYRFHGGPERAVCLFSLEHIQSLAAAGHPVAPGSLGENVTTLGLDWAALVPGRRLRLGLIVELELTSYANPCKTIAGCFSDGQFSRLKDPGVSRLYARVLVPGRLQAGDPIELDPQSV